MSTITFQTENIASHNIVLVKWIGLALGDDGEPFAGIQFPDRSVQASGTFGVGGTVKLEGRLSTDLGYVALTDPQGNDINLGSAKIEAITELVQQIRPRITGGDGTTLIDVYLLLKRA
jgi:hypothetical protein